MSNTTQDKLYETFAAISGGQASNLDPFIDASEEMAGSVSDIAKVMTSMSSTVSMGTVAAGTEPAGQPAPSAVPDSATGAGLAQLIAMVVPPGDALAAPAAAPTAPTEPLTTMAAQSPLPAVNDAGTNVRPSTTTTTGSTSESTTSTLLQNVFGSVPLAGEIAGATSGSSGGGGSTLESIASTVLKSGLGLVPLIGGLLGLFGGGDSSTPALEKYTMPGSIGYEGADTGSGVSPVDFDQMGAPRTYGNSSSGNGNNSSSSSPAPQITVSVQAMDARSFLDRSSDIAAAVRDAMLNLNSINDVVNEL